MNLIGKVVLVGLTPLLLHAGLLTGNLLTYPGAETGNISGWTVGGVSNPFVDGGTFDLGINPYSGSWDFYGHTGAYGSLSQTDSIVGGSVTTSLIDTGTLSADVSFWEQGLDQGPSSDHAYIELAFLDGSDATISTVDTPSVDSHLGFWTNYAGDYAIPVGTRSITYTMEFVREVGSDNDSFVDDNYLAISSPATGVPEPSTFGFVLLGFGLLGVVLYRRERRTAASTIALRP